jgi:hypothetical protein
MCTLTPFRDENRIVGHYGFGERGFDSHWLAGVLSSFTGNPVAIPGCRRYFFGSANTMYKFIRGAEPAASRGAW